MKELKPNFENELEDDLACNFDQDDKYFPATYQ
jgi:hypothetical protein